MTPPANDNTVPLGDWTIADIDEDLAPSRARNWRTDDDGGETAVEFVEQVAR